MGTGAGRWSVRRVTRLGFLASAGTALFILEYLIPLPLPFLKIGLANISTVLALLLSGPADAMLVVFLRVLAGSLLTGSFLGPSFVLAFTAGMVSAAAMSAFRLLGGRAFGGIGLSLIGSTAHVLTQLAIVAVVYVRNEAMIHLLPLLLITALVGGVVVGVIAVRLEPAFAAPGASLGRSSARSWTRMKIGDKAVLATVVLAIFCAFTIIPGTTGTEVLIQVDGRTVGKLDLHKNSALTFKGEKGSVRVETRDGRVRVTEADCPNRICVQTGWRSSGGEVIVCVPNRTVIRILAEEADEVRGTTG